MRHGEFGSAQVSILQKNGSVYCEGIAQKKLKTDRSMATCIKRGRSSIKKKRGYNSKKRGFRCVL